MRELVKSNDADIKINTQHWYGQLKGLIHKVTYDHLPEWLKEILISAVLLQQSLESRADGTLVFRAAILDEFLNLCVVLLN